MGNATSGVGDGVGKLGKGDVVGGLGSTLGGVGKGEFESDYSPQLPSGLEA